VIRKIADFAHRWSQESENTQKLLNTLTDASLAQPVTGDHRTLGRIAWHLTGTIKEMMEKTGLHIEGPDENAPVPASAKVIADTYARSAKSLLDAVQKEWTDATLEKTDEMYGEKWSRGETLMILVLHQTHHRGQMNVLMRQAGLPVAGVYGPAREEWAQWQMQPPAV
jgi:uncharacterized damage-inducible protein DinB